MGKKRMLILGLVFLSLMSVSVLAYESWTSQSDCISINDQALKVLANPQNPGIYYSLIQSTDTESKLSYVPHFEDTFLDAQKMIIDPYHPVYNSNGRCLQVGDIRTITLPWQTPSESILAPGYTLHGGDEHGAYGYTVLYVSKPLRMNMSTASRLRAGGGYSRSQTLLFQISDVSPRIIGYQNLGPLQELPDARVVSSDGQNKSLEPSNRLLHPGAYLILHHAVLGHTEGGEGEMYSSYSIQMDGSKGVGEDWYIRNYYEPEWYNNNYDPDIDVELCEAYYGFGNLFNGHISSFLDAQNLFQSIPEQRRCCGDDEEDLRYSIENYYCSVDGWRGLDTEGQYCSDLVTGGSGTIYLSNAVPGTIDDIINLYDGLDGCCGDDIGNSILSNSDFSQEDPQDPREPLGWDIIYSNDGITRTEYDSSHMLMRVYPGKIPDYGTAFAKTETIYYPNEEVILRIETGQSTLETETLTVLFWTEGYFDDRKTIILEGSQLTEIPLLLPNQLSTTIRINVMSNTNEPIDIDNYLEIKQISLLRKQDSDLGSVVAPLQSAVFESQFLCANDYNTDAPSDIDYINTNPLWKWWDATDQNVGYQIHKLPGADFVSNKDQWYYCDAYGQESYEAVSVQRYASFKDLLQPGQLMCSQRVQPSDFEVIPATIDEITYEMGNYLFSSICTQETVSDEYDWGLMLSELYDNGEFSSIYSSDDFDPTVLTGCCAVAQSGRNFPHQGWDTFISDTPDDISCPTRCWDRSGNPTTMDDPLTDPPDGDPVEDFNRVPKEGLDTGIPSWSPILNTDDTCAVYAATEGLFPYAECSPQSVCMPGSDPESHGTRLVRTDGSEVMCCVGGSCVLPSSRSCEELAQGENYKIYDSSLGYHTCYGILYQAPEHVDLPLPYDSCCVGLTVWDVSAESINNAVNESFICYEGNQQTGLFGECCSGTECYNNAIVGTVNRMDKGNVFSSGSQLYTIISFDQAQADEVGVIDYVGHYSYTPTISSVPPTRLLNPSLSVQKEWQDFSEFDTLTFDLLWKGRYMPKELHFYSGLEQIAAVSLQDKSIIQGLPAGLWHHITVPVPKAQGITRLNILQEDISGQPIGTDLYLDNFVLHKKGDVLVEDDYAGTFNYGGFELGQVGNYVPTGWSRIGFAPTTFTVIENTEEAYERDLYLSMDKTSVGSSGVISTSGFTIGDASPSTPLPQYKLSARVSTDAQYTGREGERVRIGIECWSGNNLVPLSIIDDSQAYLGVAGEYLYAEIALIFELDRLYNCKPQIILEDDLIGKVLVDDVKVQTYEFIPNDRKQNYYCTGEFRSWIPNLYPVDADNNGLLSSELAPYQRACDSQLSFTWTGTSCCGANSTKASTQDRSLAEYYNDTLGACWGGVGIKNDEPVHIKHGTVEFDANILYYDGEFHSCFDDVAAFTDKNGNIVGPLEGLDAFTIKGSWYCIPSDNGNPYSMWRRTSDLPRVRILMSQLSSLPQENNYALHCDETGEADDRTLVVNDALGISANPEQSDAYCVLNIFETDSSTETEQVVIGSVISDGIAVSEFISGTLQEFYPTNMTEQFDVDCSSYMLPDGSGTQPMPDTVDDTTSFFKQCLINPSSRDLGVDIEVYYNKPFNLVYFSFGSVTQSTSFFADLWESIINFFRNLFSDDDQSTVSDSPVIGTSLLLGADFTHSYLTQVGNRQIVGSVERIGGPLGSNAYEDMQYERHMRVDYINFSSDISPLKDIVMTSGAFGTDDVFYCSNEETQSIFLRMERGEFFDWRYITSNLRVNTVPGPVYSGSNGDPRCYLHNGRIDQDEVCDDTYDNFGNILVVADSIIANSHPDGSERLAVLCQGGSGVMDRCINGQLDISQCGDTDYMLFATSTVYTGDFGGVEGGDYICRNIAAQNNNVPSLYAEQAFALLSTVDTSMNLHNAIDRFTNLEAAVYDSSANPIILKTSVNALFDGGSTPLNDWIKNENGQALSGQAWTGTSKSGIASSGSTPDSFDCADWGQTRSGISGNAGDLTQTLSNNWLYIRAQSCGEQKHLYCVVPYSAS